MTDNAIVPVAEAVNHKITSLAEAAADYAASGKAANTRRAYESDFADFASWCASVGADPLPASAPLLALYLTERAATLAVSTLARRIAAINAAHDHNGMPPPRGAELSAVWDGIRRRHGRPPRKKRGLLVDDLVKVCRKLPDTLTGVRDRAILAVGFAGALRREELAALSFDANARVRAEFVAEGLLIHIGKSKGDQEGNGAIVAVPHGKRLCPVAALQAWLTASGETSGPVFRAINCHGQVWGDGVCDKTIATVVKRAVKAAGFDPRQFGGHSLRRGLATSAHRGGAADGEIQRHLRHARLETTMGYVEDASRFATTAARKARL